MEIEKQVPAKQNSAGNSAVNDVNASEPVIGKRDAPDPVLVSVPRPELQVPRVPDRERPVRFLFLHSPKATGNQDRRTVSGSPAMMMAWVQSLRDMLNLPADTAPS